MHASTSRWQSLRVRLPLTISLVVTAILAVVVVAAYREVRSALIASGIERSRTASAQVASLLEASLRNSTAQVGNAAKVPTLRESITTRHEGQLAELDATLRKFSTGAGPRSVTLWDDRGTRLAEVVTPARPGATGLTELPPSTAPSSPGLRLWPAGDGAILEASAAVLDLAPAPATVGFLVIRSSFAVNPPGLFSRLVGGDAAVLLGNRDGSVWVDLATSRRAAGAISAGSDGVRLQREGAARVGAVTDVRDSSLRILVDFPESQILAPAQRFLRRMILLTLLAAIASALMIRALTVRVTRPLAELTHATEAVAGGDYTRTVGDARGDELGRLGRAFDAMTKKVAADITERERITASLHDNEERLRYTLSAARIGIWQMDVATGRFEWSEAMAQLFGMEASALPAGRGAALDLVHPEDRDAVAASLIRDPADRREHEIGFRALQRDGSYRWFVGRSRQVTDASGVLRLVGVLIDVTEQRTLEEQLRQSQKMDAIGKLAGGVAHDFNNLLTAILGFGQLLLEDLAPADPRREQMEAILKAAARAADLTSQLLAFSRQQLLQPVIVDVNAAVRETTVLLRRLIGENIQLEVVPSAATAQVRADASQLQQILMNLSINARDAMREGGRLTIEVAIVNLDESYGGQHFEVRPGAYVMIAVTDTGAGMTDVVRARLFEPFFTTKRRGEGTGLGLATVYGAVKQAGGYIWVYSEPGSGSTFKVYLPRVDGEPAPEAAAPVERVAAGNETILLVEDEEGVRTLATLILERAGYRVVSATSAEEADRTHLQHAGSIRLLITDVVLPGSSGPDLFQRLTLRDPKLKVLYMSGYTDDAVFRTGRLEPGVAFMQKPFTAVVLRQKIREILDA
jgi:PAS domain S-box-containing protein